MSKKLRKIIAYYEDERDRLDALIAECLAEYEYKLAHRNQKSLGLINRRLQVDYSLADPLHDQKTGLQRQIDGLYKMLRDRIEADSVRVQAYLMANIQRKQQELANLNQMPPAVPVPPTLAFDEVLEKLLNRTVERFTLTIGAAGKVCFTGRLVRRTLIITLVQMRWVGEKYGLFKDQRKYLQLLGFRWYDQRDKLMLFLPYTEKQHIHDVKRLFAQIVFEVFYFKEFEGGASLKYMEKISS